MYRFFEYISVPITVLSLLIGIVATFLTVWRELKWGWSRKQNLRDELSSLLAAQSQNPESYPHLTESRVRVMTSALHFLDLDIADGAVAECRRRVTWHERAAEWQVLKIIVLWLGVAIIGASIALLPFIAIPILVKFVLGFYFSILLGFTLLYLIDCIKDRRQIKKRSDERNLVAGGVVSSESLFTEGR